MSQITTDDKIRFRGVCLNGPLKGKEIEGKLNIEFNIESIKSKRKPAETGWSSIVVIGLLLLGLNAVAFNRPDVPPTRSPSSPSNQEVPQWVEDQVSAYEAN